MRPLEKLNDSPNFKLYSDSSKGIVGFSELPFLLQAKVLKKHNNILVEQYHKDRINLLVYVDGELVHTDFYKDNNYLLIEYDYPVIFCTEYLESSYIIIGHWT